MTNVIVICGKVGKVRMCVETRRRSRAGGKGGYEVIFLYGEEYLSLKEMLEREDILRYLRRNGQESSDSALCKGFGRVYTRVVLQRRWLRTTQRDRNPFPHRW